MHHRIHAMNVLRSICNANHMWRRVAFASAIVYRLIHRAGVRARQRAALRALSITCKRSRCRRNIRAHRHGADRVALGHIWDNIEPFKSMHLFLNLSCQLASLE